MNDLKNGECVVSVYGDNSKRIDFKVDDIRYVLKVWKDDIDDDESFCLKEWREMTQKWRKIYHEDNSDKSPRQYTKSDGYIVNKLPYWSNMNYFKVIEDINDLLNRNGFGKYHIKSKNDILSQYHLQVVTEKIRCGEYTKRHVDRKEGDC